jgi:hypothetical protein
MISRKTLVSFGALACFIGCAGDFAVILFFGQFYPGYSQLHNTMSSLGAAISPVSNIVSISWIILGLMFIFFAYVFGKSYSPSSKYTNLAALLIAIYGFGEFIGSGLFKADHIGNSITQSAVVHGILGSIGIGAMSVLPLVMLLIIPPAENRGLRRLSWIVFFSTTVLLVLFNYWYFQPGPSVLTRLEGLWQRLLALNYYIYLSTIAYLMLKNQIVVKQRLNNE